MSLYLCPRGTKSSYAMAHVGDALLLLSLLSQCPGPPDGCLSQPELTGPVLRAECYWGLCPFLVQLHLSALYADRVRNDQSENNTEGMIQFPSESQSLERQL